MVNEPNDRQPLSMKDAVSILYVAQHQDVNKDYAEFCTFLQKEHIPWDFDDERFLEEVEGLKQKLTTRLSLEKNTDVNETARDAYARSLSQEELVSLEQGLEQTQQQKKAYKTRVSTYTKSVVDEYVNKLKTTASPLLENQEGVLRQTLAQATQKALDVGSMSVLNQALSASIPDAASAPPEIQTALSEVGRLTKITEAVLTSNDNVHRGAFMDQCLADPTISVEILESKYSGAQERKILSLSEDVKANIETQLGAVDERGVSAEKEAFKKAAISARRGAAQPIDDIVTAIGGPQGKEFISSVIETVLGRSVDEAKQGTLGGVEIKTNEWTQEKIRYMEGSLLQKREIQKTTQGAARTFFKHGKLAAAGAPDARLVNAAASLWGPSIQQGVRVYLETASIGVSTMAPEYAHYFILAGTDIWNTLLGKAAVDTTKSVLKRQTANAVTGAAIKTVAFLVGGVPGTALSLFVTGFVGKAITLVGKGIKGISSFFRADEIYKGILGIAGGSQGKEDDGVDTLLPILILGGVAVLIFLSFYREILTSSAFMAVKGQSSGVNAQNSGKGFRHGDPTVANPSTYTPPPPPVPLPTDYCAKNPTAPECQPVTPDPNNPWPVVSANPNIDPYITQGPGGSWSHTGASGNAVDIGLPLQSTALSPVSGTVIKTVNQYPDNSGYAGSSAGGGYGNYVLIQTTPVNGVSNTLIVAHLAYNSMPAVGTTVSLGSTIGRSGNTGNSTGSHFHFGFTNSGAPSINSILPVVVPVGCSSAASCGYIKAG